MPRHQAQYTSPDMMTRHAASLLFSGFLLFLAENGEINRAIGAVPVKLRIVRVVIVAAVLEYKQRI